MAKRKLLSEMDPFERVQSRLKGMKNEEVEDVACKMLAQVFAKHIYIFKDGEEYSMKLMKHIADETVAYTKEHTFELALGAVCEKNKDKIAALEKKWEELEKLRHGKGNRQTE